MFHFPVLVGAGGVASIVDRYYYSWDDEYYYETLDSEAYFVFEPGVEVEFNMVKFFRIGLGASYRITSDVKLRKELSDYEKKDCKLRWFIFWSLNEIW